MTAHPTLMDFGAFHLISPDGTDQIPADLWPELELAILLEPQPAELKIWRRRFEERLGVTERHRNVVAAPWYILQATAWQEPRAIASLTELEVQSYLPCETVKRKLCRREVIVHRALFPGYLFARIPDHLFHAATHAEGVRAPVRFTSATGERVPRTVNAGMVEALRAAQAAGDFDQTKEVPKPPLVQGDRVRITEGAFEGRLGNLLKFKSGDRMKVMLDGYGKTTLDAVLVEAV
jgi:transcription antitermination factor NusG